MNRSRRRHLRIAAATGLASLAGLAAATPASAAPSGGATPALSRTAGTNLLTDGTLDQPGAEGATPTGWTLVNLDNETAPYAANINQYNSTGTYPPPTPVPNASGYASKAFYEGGSNTGPEGIGGQQTASTFGSVTQADDPQVSYSTAETYAPSPSVVSWAGSVLQVVVTSGAQSYTLRYFDPFTPVSGSYSGAPTGSASVHYVTGPTLTKGTWTTTAPRDLGTDLKAAFGLTSYTVSSVTYGDLEGTTSSGSPYPNETSYWTNVDLAEGSTAPAALPESPAVVMLPLAGATLLAGGLLLRRKRRAQTPAPDAG